MQKCPSSQFALPIKSVRQGMAVLHRSVNLLTQGWRYNDKWTRRGQSGKSKPHRKNNITERKGLKLLLAEPKARPTSSPWSESHTGVKHIFIGSKGQITTHNPLI